MSEYRYRLERNTGPTGPVFAFFGVNPSTANEKTDDATVRRWIGFCERMSVKRFLVGNLFALRATDVRLLRSHADAVGPENREHLVGICQEADVLVPCWGSRAKIPEPLHTQIELVWDILWDSRKPILHWGVTASGDPRHPLMLGYDTPLVPYEHIRSRVLL